MSGFDADWLAQREPFDLAARSRLLEQAFAAELVRNRPHAAIRLADLGGGTAANFRALAPSWAAISSGCCWIMMSNCSPMRRPGSRVGRAPAAGRLVSRVSAARC